MTFIKTGLIFFFCLVLELNACVISTDLVKTVANVTNAISDYFSVQCVYFIRSCNSDDNILNLRLTKSISLELGKSLGVFCWSEYEGLLGRGQQNQCHLPLRVILGLNESKSFRNFNKVYANHSDLVRTGAWLVFLESLHEDFVAHFFREVYLPFEVEIIAAFVHNEWVELKEVYQVDPSFPIRQPTFGNWSLKTGLTSPGYSSLYLRRTNLEGIQLRVGYINHNQPFIMTEGTSLVGYSADIWRILQEVLNISSAFVEVNYNRGREENKNSWLIIIKMLKQGELDVGLGDFIISVPRLDIVDFSHPVLESRFQVFHRVSQRDFWPHTHFLPFEKKIWLAILLWSALHSLSISWTCFMIKEHVPNIFFMTIGGLCGQSVQNIPKSPSCRILFLITYVVAAVLIPSYSASLTRYLTTTPAGIVFKDLGHFYTSGTHRMIVVDGSFEYYFFLWGIPFQNLSENKEHRMKIFEEHIKNKELPSSYKEALHLVCRDSNTAFFTVTSTLIWEWNQAENLELRDRCSLKKMSQDAGKLMSSFLYQKKSRFKGIINHHLRRLDSAGILDRLRMKYWANNPEKPKKQIASVGLRESSTIFLILIMGVIFSVFIVILETAMKQLRPVTRKRLRKKKRYRPYIFP